MSLSPGTLLENRYQIVRLLGQGGFGAVYRAWDTKLCGPCAVKENFDTSSAAQQQFTREATMLFNLRHPNLPRVFDAFSVPGQGQYLVMDYIEGEDLEQMLERTGGALPAKEVLPWMVQVCDALTYLHNQAPPIIHRDIKPANIRVTPRKEVYLVDFGIAKLYDPQLKTTIGARAVTPGYSPLEQYGTGMTDARSDVYALGAMIYRLLTAEVPQESVQRVVTDRLLLANQVNPAVSPTTGRVLQRALQIPLEQRYQSAAEFKQALLEAQAAVRRPAVVSPPPPAYPAGSYAASEAGWGRSSVPRTEVVTPRRKSKPSVAPAPQGRRVSCWVWATAIFGLLVLLGVIGSIGLFALGLLAFGGGNVATPVGALPGGRASTTPAPAALTQTAQSVLGATATEKAANSQATSTARTSGEMATTTAEAQALAATSTAALASAAGRMTQVYHLAEDVLTHDDDGYIEQKVLNDSLKDLVISVTFHNPYQAGEPNWDYGFLFRNNSDSQFRLRFLSTGRWILTEKIGSESTYLQKGDVENLNTGYPGSNEIMFVIEGTTGWFSVNGVYISSLDLSKNNAAGKLSVATEMTDGYSVPGKVVKLTDLTVWEILPEGDQK